MNEREAVAQGDDDFLHTRIVLHAVVKGEDEIHLDILFYLVLIYTLYLIYIFFQSNEVLNKIFP